jgi:hypothetical protein
MSKVQLEHDFPKLNRSNYQITSQEDISYNCIAWAAGDDLRWWWPVGYYWPPGVKRESSLAAFIDAFSTLGYSVCTSSDYEQGFEKIAIYAKQNGAPSHAARQVHANRWTSKAGSLEDFEHELEDVCGSRYGSVAVFMKRPVDIGS